MTYRLRNISIAIVLAVVAALLTMFYTKSFQSNVRSDETNVPIYVAARDIPAGTSSANATAKGMLTKSEIVRRSVVPGAITKPEQLDRPRRHAADLRGRADHDPPLLRSV